MEGDKKCKDCIRCYKTRELEHMLQTTNADEECEKDSWDDWDLTEVQNLLPTLLQMIVFIPRQGRGS
jgi:hypothetical protein